LIPFLPDTPARPHPYAGSSCPLFAHTWSIIPMTGHFPHSRLQWPPPSPRICKRHKSFLSLNDQISSLALTWPLTLSLPPVSRTTLFFFPSHAHRTTIVIAGSEGQYPPPWHAAPPRFFDRSGLPAPPRTLFPSITARASTSSSVVVVKQ